MRSSKLFEDTLQRYDGLEHQVENIIGHEVRSSCACCLLLCRFAALLLRIVITFLFFIHFSPFFFVLKPLTSQIHPAPATGAQTPLKIRLDFMICRYLDTSTVLVRKSLMRTVSAGLAPVTTEAAHTPCTAVSTELIQWLWGRPGQGGLRGLGNLACVKPDMHSRHLSRRLRLRTLAQAHANRYLGRLLVPPATIYIHMYRGTG
eukprot:COSAG05_NODE_444_length_9777_cov_20.852965_10_plen_204_part_00